MLWDPLHFLESCPSSDGAARWCSRTRRGAKKAPRQPAWVIAHAKRTELGQFPGRDTGAARRPASSARRRSTRRPASRTRVEQIDCAELYVPFSWYEPMWLEGHDHRRPGRGLEA